MSVDEKQTGDARSIGRRVLQIESRAIGDLVDRLDATFDRAVDLLVDCSGRVIVTGMGKSGIIAQKIAATLSSTGRPAHFLHPAEAVHGDLGMIVDGDLLFALSNSGETAELVRLLELVRRIDAKIIAVSGNSRSTLARFADVHLDVGVDQEACGMDLVPTASTTAALAMGDALAIAAFERRGFSFAEFARFHPGGRLGRKLQQVADLMHRGEDVPSVPKSATIHAAIEEMDRKKLGMTCVVDENGRLAGILTDGDLRRRMLRKAQPMEGTAGDAMTRDPATIGEAAVAATALKRMEELKITSLPVVDRQNGLIGVIQIHDLWRTELF